MRLQGWGGGDNFFYRVRRYSSRLRVGACNAVSGKSARIQIRRVPYIVIGIERWSDGTFQLFRRAIGKKGMGWRQG